MRRKKISLLYEYISPEIALIAGLVLSTAVFVYLYVYHREKLIDIVDGILFMLGLTFGAIFGNMFSSGSYYKVKHKPEIYGRLPEDGYIHNDRRRKTYP